MTLGGPKEAPTGSAKVTTDAGEDEDDSVATTTTSPEGSIVRAGK